MSDQQGKSSTNTWDVCQRCFTTHPLDENFKRPCPKPPSEPKSLGPQVVFKGGGWYFKDSQKINCPNDVA